MGNKFVFFTYMITAVFAVVTIVLAAVMQTRQPEYRKKELRSVTASAAGMLLIQSVFFLSYFDYVASQSESYDIFTRVMDILCSFICNFFWFRYISFFLERKTGKPAPFRKPVSIYIAASFGAGEYGYFFLLDEDYMADTVSGTAAVCILQILMTIAIVGVSAVYTIFAWKKISHSNITSAIVFGSSVNICLGLYNGVMSILIFRGKLLYENWNGTNDLNNILYVLQGMALFTLIYLYWRDFHGEMAQDRAVEEKGKKPPAIDPALGLTPRETEIAYLILEKLTYDEIAEKLCISKYTVKRHVHNIYEKTGAEGRGDLIVRLTLEK